MCNLNESIDADSQVIGSNASSVRIPLVVGEKIRPCRWLELVLCVPFSALTLMAGWQDGRLLRKKMPVPLIPRGRMHDTVVS